MFHEARFPLAAGVTQKEIGAGLESLKALRRENAKFWNWLGGPPRKRPRADKDTNAVAWEVTMEDGATVLGNVELRGRCLVLSCRR